MISIRTSLAWSPASNSAAQPVASCWSSLHQLFPVPGKLSPRSLHAPTPLSPSHVLKYHLLTRLTLTALLKRHHSPPALILCFISSLLSSTDYLPLCYTICTYFLRFLSIVCFCPFLKDELSSMRAEFFFLFCSLIYSQCLECSPTHSRHSINIEWTNKQANEWMRFSRIYK